MWFLATTIGFGGTLFFFALAHGANAYARSRYASALAYVVGFMVAGLLFVGARDRVDPARIASARFDIGQRGATAASPVTDLAQIRAFAFSAHGMLEHVGRLARTPSGAAIVDATHFASSERVTLSGWGAEPDTDRPGSALLVVVDGRGFRLLPRDSTRPRAALTSATSMPPNANLGFVASLQAADIGSGLHKLSVGVVEEQGLRYFPVVGDVVIEVGDP